MGHSVTRPVMIKRWIQHGEIMSSGKYSKHSKHSRYTRRSNLRSSLAQALGRNAHGKNSTRKKVNHVLTLRVSAVSLKDFPLILVTTVNKVLEKDTCLREVQLISTHRVAQPPT